MFENIATIKSHNSEQFYQNKFLAKGQDIVSSQIHISLLNSLLWPTFILVNGVSLALTLYLGFRAYASGAASIGDIFAAINYLAQVEMPFLGLGFAFDIQQKGFSNIRRIKQGLSINTSADSHTYKTLQKTLTGALAVQKLQYSFHELYTDTTTSLSPTLQEQSTAEKKKEEESEGATHFTLGPITLSMPAGTWLGVTGSIGSGKSTLSKLLAKIYEQKDADAILWDDISIEKLDTEYFRTQWDTQIGEAGILLSGGQKQRVTLARTLLANTPILILDDIFSGLDNRTSKLVLQSLLISSATMFGYSLLNTLLVEKILLTLRQRVVQHAFSHSMDFFSNEPIGKLITLTTRDLDSIGNFFRNVISQILGSVISFFVVLVMLYILSWELALVTLSIVPIAAFFVNYYRKKVLVLSRDVRENTGKINTYLSEHLQGKLDIQLHGKLEQSFSSFNAVANAIYRSKYRLNEKHKLLRPFLNLLLIVITVSVLITGTVLSYNGLITIGIIIGYIQLINRFFYPLITIAQHITQLQESVVGFDKIFSFLHTKSSIRSPKETSDIVSAISKSKNCTLAFHDVSFAYKNKDYVLHNISFELTPNSTIALVGHSGSGKSTIVKLCMRFWDPSKGSITLNGKDIRTLPLALLRKHIGFLHQDNLIFQGSIRENIEIGRKIDSKKLERVAQESNLDVIMSRSQWNWDSKIEKNTLSIGEQRIIAICRVLVDAPQFLLLDEFSATLDNATESIIQTLLHTLQKERGTILIAHKLNTIQNADEILFLQSGKIIERGTHTALLAKKKHYYHMLQNLHETIGAKTDVALHT
ncbi:uncharacterized ABC transporter ATP-binding protein YknV-like [Ylistrum balloti]|uniref:uncharacterized ABC transporter ATP-binding protein YknV-like n=1 Tax=Ylistrum balloti TaxID=509963 RepID=UPI002905AA1A|nr:uncharacterized ABC transporter ATP-binding protein YknV-like [Ylistrum balloti]